MHLFAFVLAALAVAGIAHGIAGLVCLHLFGRQRRAGEASARPPVTVLKPLYGDEPLLDEALSSIFAQDYPAFQVVLGVQDPRDAAIDTVRRVQARYPAVDSVLVIDGSRHGRNKKVGNLINMMHAAKHDLIVIADSDVHVLPDYLHSIADAFQAPGTGLVTTLYTGLPVPGSVVASLGATAVTHGFLTSALVSRALGREDCLGATMALPRPVLESIGGLEAVADDLADDAALGRAVRHQGLHIRFAATVPATTVPERTIAPLFWHEVRWARVIRMQVPVMLAFSTIQYPLAWALLCAACAGGAAWSLALFLAVWAARGVIGAGIDRVLFRIRVAGFHPVPWPWLPLRDLLSVAVVVASYFSARVRWRGEVLNVCADQPDMAGIDAMSFGAERP